MKNDEGAFLLLNSAMMLYSRPSVSAGTWFQGAPKDTKIYRCSSPLYRMVSYNDNSWRLVSASFASVDMDN